MSVKTSLKCYRCKTVFTGDSLDTILLDNNIKVDKGGYYCECKIVDKFADMITKKERMRAERSKKKADDELY